MVGDVAAAWGFFGGFAAVGFELYDAVRRDGRWPWKHPPNPKAGEIAEAEAKAYVIVEAIRLVIGAGLAWAAAATGQIAGPLGALGVGVAAPTIIGQLAKVVPLSVSPDRAATHVARVPASTSPSRKYEKSLRPAIAVDGSAEAVD
jgi:hypothetical protein